MIIKKEMLINEVMGSNCQNAPFRLVLIDKNHWGRCKASLTMNEETCKKFHIPPSLELVGKTLVCTFQSRRLPKVKKGDGWAGFPHLSSVKDDEIGIEFLEKNESSMPFIRSSPPSKNEKVTHKLVLVSFGGGDGIHLTIMPCPFYKIELELTEQEYNNCKKLPATAIFKVSFQLLK